MKTLKVTSMGETVQGVTLKGDPRSPEPESFRVVLPGGDVDIVRTTVREGQYVRVSYWVHVRVDREKHTPDVAEGKFLEGRLDVDGKSTSEVDYGDFDSEGLYHVAVRIGLKEPT